MADLSAAHCNTATALRAWLQHGDEASAGKPSGFYEVQSMCRGRTYADLLLDANSKPKGEMIFMDNHAST